jgi:uncharacterized protein
MSSAVTIEKCELGLGLFAATDIRANSAIFRFEGQILRTPQVEALGDAACYPIQIGPTEYLDPQPPGRFINHSCAPNTGIRNDNELIALVDIHCGEELRFDYSTTMSERSWTMACHCGAPACRKLIRDFRELPTTLQQHYLSLGIVQSFIVMDMRSGHVAGAISCEVPPQDQKVSGP